MDSIRVALVHRTRERQTTSSEISTQYLLMNLVSSQWLAVGQVTDFAWSHDGRMALIAYKDGFVLVGSVQGQRYWSSQLNLQPHGSSITCGAWTADDKTVSVFTLDHLFLAILCCFHCDLFCPFWRFCPLKYYPQLTFSIMSWLTFTLDIYHCQFKTLFCRSFCRSKNRINFFSNIEKWNERICWRFSCFCWTVTTLGRAKEEAERVEWLFSAQLSSFCPPFGLLCDDKMRIRHAGNQPQFNSIPFNSTYFHSFLFCLLCHQYSSKITTLQSLSFELLEQFPYQRTLN